MNKIDNKTFSCLFFFLSNQMILSVGINHILSISYQNSIYVPLISFVIGLIPFFILIRYFNYKPELNVFEKIEYTYGIIGKIINFIIFLLITFYLIYSLSTTNIYIQNKYLNQTPTLVISLLFLLPTIYLLNTSIKTICKTAFLLFLIYIIIYILSLFGLFNYCEIDNLKPFLDKDIFTLSKSSIYFNIYMLYPTYLLLIIPKNNINGNTNKSLFIFYLMSIIALFFIIINLISTLGIDLSLIYDFPIFALLKKINYFNFISHIENLLSFMSVIVFFINTIMSMYAIKTYLNNTYFTYFIIIICLIISLTIFNNHSLIINIMKKYFIMTFIPVIIILIKKKKEH